jgi:two-component system response regulator FixJ
LHGTTVRSAPYIPTRFIRVKTTEHDGGTIDVLAKPFSNDGLLARVEAGFSRTDANKKNNVWIAELRRCYDKLTDRKHQVVQHLVTGLSSKELAELPGVSHRTVQVPRRCIMKTWR